MSSCSLPLCGCLKTKHSGCCTTGMSVPCSCSTLFGSQKFCFQTMLVGVSQEKSVCNVLGYPVTSLGLLGATRVHLGSSGITASQGISGNPRHLCLRVYMHTPSKHSCPPPTHTAPCSAGSCQCLRTHCLPAAAHAHSPQHSSSPGHTSVGRGGKSVLLNNQEQST